MSLYVAVIEGGPSSEAAVSRSSAEGVAAALEAAGHRVRRLELASSLPAALAEAQPDVVFPIVHGALGEDGCLQGVLEVLALPYVGSGVLASALASDKIAAKIVFRKHGLPVAEEVVVARGEDLARAAVEVRTALGRAVVVKPGEQGSAIGVTRVTAGAADSELERALELALSFDERALCERFVIGREVTCGVLDAPPLGPTRALPPTEIFAKLADFYDFRSRYATGGSEHVCPAQLPPSVLQNVQQVALAAHRALGCRDLSRVDFVVGDGGDGNGVTLLEVNTLPGMTATSLYPEAARVAGIPMDHLCDGLVRTAHARGTRRCHPAVPLPG
ncbi:MAG TPA: D-alanine--D-alanine ligase [Polyangiaceae bacterium]